MRTHDLLKLDDEWRLEGALVARQRTLLRQLSLRFGRIPMVVRHWVELTKSMPELEEWLDLVLTAPTLDDMGIDPKLGSLKTRDAAHILRHLLLEVLRERFDDWPDGVFRDVMLLKDSVRLEEWLNRAETALCERDAFRHPDHIPGARVAASLQTAAAEKRKRTKRAVRKSRPTPARKPKM